MKNKKFISLLCLLICIAMLGASFTGCATKKKKSDRKSRRVEDEDDDGAGNRDGISSIRQDV